MLKGLIFPVLLVEDELSRTNETLFNVVLVLVCVCLGGFVLFCFVFS